MRSTVYALAAAALSLLPGGAQAHMIMKTPVPFGLPDLDNSPLTPGIFPCKVKGDPAAFFDRRTTKPTVMGVGETQTLSFRGSAVHGGGSCQLAVTGDAVPSKTSAWEVILSLEGGCPSKDGSGPSEYAFRIPDQIKPGEYVFAWTWISKLSGQPEYYMNCAPITVTAGGGSSSSSSKKRDAAPPGGGGTSPSAALPNLFVANLAGINNCKTTPGTDVLYPQPGPYVEKLGTKNNFAAIHVDGGSCTAGGGGSDAPGSGSGSGGGGGGGGDGSPGNGGGSGSPNSGGGGASATTPAAPPTPTTVVSGSSSSSSSTGAAPTGGAPSSGGGGGGGGGLSGACSEEGVFNCVGGTEYQQCASGRWTALQAMPAGTTCKLGQSSTLWNRAAPRPRPVRRML